MSRSAPPPAALPADNAPRYTARELAAAAGVAARSVRHYVALGMLPPTEFRGPRTVYGREHLVRLRAIVRLRKQHTYIDRVREALKRMTPAQIEALGATEPAPVASSPAPAASPEESARYRPALARPRAHWEHIVLCPGVELHVRHDADVEAARIAREIVERYAIEVT